MDVKHSCCGEHMDLHAELQTAEMEYTWSLQAQIIIARLAHGSTDSWCYHGHRHYTSPAGDQKMMSSSLSPLSTMPAAVSMETPRLSATSPAVFSAA